MAEVSPAFSLSAETGDYSLSARYLLQHYQYFEVEQRDQSMHQLDLKSNIDLYRDKFFLDLGASRNQQIADPEQRVGNGRFTPANRRADVTVKRLSPYAVGRHRNGIRSNTRVAFEKVSFDNADQADSNNRSVMLRVDNYSSGEMLGWAVDYYNMSMKLDQVGNNQFEDLNLSGLYRINRRFSVSATIGYEDNDYQQASGSEPPKGSTWGVDLSYQPGRNSRASLGFKERFFGNTYTLDMQHRLGKSSFNLSYSKDVTTTAQEQAQRRPEEDAVLFSDEVLSGSNEVYIQERVTLALSKQFLRSQASVYLRSESNSFQLSGSEEEMYGGGFDWSWMLSRKTTLSWSVNRNVRDTQSVLDHWVQRDATLSLIHALGRSVSLDLSYQYMERESPIWFLSYNENVATVKLNMQW